jgi:phospholipid/cholesterol/gamma-HCH transport system substrate-binding protein
MLATAERTAGGVNMLVSDNQASIALILKNLNTLSAALIETEKGFKPILGNLKTTTDSLKALQLGKTLNEANEAIASLQKTLLNLENGKGTAGKLLKDETLYNNLNRTMVSVNQLMTNFREYPKRYVSLSVFGKKDKGPAVSVLDTTTK